MSDVIISRTDPSVEYNLIGVEHGTVVRVIERVIRRRAGSAITVGAISRKNNQVIICDNIHVDRDIAVVNGVYAIDYEHLCREATGNGIVANRRAIFEITGYCQPVSPHLCARDDLRP